MIFECGMTKPGKCLQLLTSYDERNSANYPTSVGFNLVTPTDQHDKI
jgi:hypothetical protein